MQHIITIISHTELKHGVITGVRKEAKVFISERISNGHCKFFFDYLSVGSISKYLSWPVLYPHI